MMIMSFSRIAASGSPRPNLKKIINRSSVKASASDNTHISDETLEKLGTLSSQELASALEVMGCRGAQLDGSRSLSPSKKCVGRALTIKVVPSCPDNTQAKLVGVEGRENEAFERLGPNDILVMSAFEPWECMSNDIFLRLKQHQIGGLVTDGSLRDIDKIMNYGFPCYNVSTNFEQALAGTQPWSCKTVMKCGSIVIHSGDIIVGDQDGLVVVPAKLAGKVCNSVHGSEEIKERITEGNPRMQ